MLVVIDAQIAEAARLKAERARLRRARYEDKHPERKRHHGTSDNHNPNRPKYGEYEFVMWDGEAPKDTGYALFGSSLGHEICKPHLSTEDCFDLLLSAKQENPYTIFVIFGGRYDFDEICRQSIPLNRLLRLKTFGHCYWHGYEIKQAEGKFFKLRKGGVSVTVWEVFGWFHKAYVKALRDYDIGTEAQWAHLSAEKANRSEFLWADIGGIRQYWQLEMQLGVPLMDKIRQICHDAGFQPRAWYGPSALALEALRRNKITDYMGEVPSAVKLASQYAYAGGRFEDVRGGVLSPVYSYDQNSAYMHAALDLPCLAHGTWKQSAKYVPGKFGIYHIHYDGSKAVYPPNGRNADESYIHPLFMRHKTGSVSWPAKVEGWYWSPEAELVADSPYARFLAGYYFEPGCSHKPFAFVVDWYRKRQILEGIGSPAGKAFKWALAALYGQLARTVGWDRRNHKPPKYHQLEWAGYITSKCRAAMYRVAKQANDKLISIDTDSVTAMCPLDVPIGTALGEWKATQYDHGVFFQSGVYALSKDGEWADRRARGIEEDRITRRVPVSPEMLISAVLDGTPITLKPRTRYISIRMALNHRLGEMGDWKKHPADKLVFGGAGKRYHRTSTCHNRPSGMRVCPSAESHVFVPRPQMAYVDYVFAEFPKSAPHLLPWKDDMSDVPDKNLIADILWIDPERVDSEDLEWLTPLL
jgi:hypothetical protein